MSLSVNPSFIAYKQPSQAWKVRFSSLKSQQNREGFTLEQGSLYATLRTPRAELIPKFSHCLTITNRSQYSSTLRILHVNDCKSLTRTARIRRKQRNLQHKERLVPLYQSQSAAGFLDLPRRLLR